MDTNLNYDDGMKKRMTAFRIEDNLRDLANEMILVRAVKRSKKPESFSELIRNLIKEEWKRNKKELQQLANETN